MVRKSKIILPVEQAPLFSVDAKGRMMASGKRIIWNYKGDEVAVARQEEALQALRSVEVSMPLMAGSGPGMTLLDNVEPHIKGRDLSDGVNFYLTDFHNAFGQVDQDALKEMVESILSTYAQGAHYREARQIIMVYLKDGAFLPGWSGLPQGNKTSTDLFDWYMLAADTEVQCAITRRHLGEVATRYIDDLTVSGPEGALGAGFCRSIRDSYRRLAPGMDVAPGKSKYKRLGPGSPPVTITGLSVYPDGRITPSRGLIESARLVFAEAEQLLAEGVTPTEHDIGVVAGYLGVLALGGETSRSGSSNIRDMGRQGHKLVWLMKTMKRQASLDSLGRQDYY